MLLQSDIDNRSTTAGSPKTHNTQIRCFLLDSEMSVETALGLRSKNELFTVERQSCGVNNHVCIRRLSAYIVTALSVRSYDYVNVSYYSKLVYYCLFACASGKNR